MLKMAIASLALIWLTGCATGTDIKNAPNEAGISRDFHFSYEKTKHYALESVEGLGLDVDEIDERENIYTILFSQRAGLMSWGEVGRVNVNDMLNGSRVHVYSLKRSRMQLTGTNNNTFAENIFSGIEKAAASDQ